MFIRLIFFISCFSNSLSTKVVQHIPPITIESGKEIDKLTMFLRPVKFTQSGMEKFFKTTFNDFEYKDFLSHDFSHMLQFVKVYKESLHPRTCIQNSIELFIPKVQSTLYLNVYMYVDFLHEFQELLNSACSREQDVTERCKIIRDSIYNNFFKNYNLFKSDPDRFVDAAALDVIKAIDNQSQEHDVPLYELQRTIAEFLTVSINKLLWSPSYKKYNWQAFKAIAVKLEDFLNANMIPNVTFLNKLYWALIERFSYFLTLSGSELTNEEYLEIEKDLDNKKLLIFALDEQEMFIMPKVTYLKNYVFHGHAKSHAKNFGIITEEIVPLKKVDVNKLDAASGKS